MQQEPSSTLVKRTSHHQNNNAQKITRRNNSSSSSSKMSIISQNELEDRVESIIVPDNDDHNNNSSSSRKQRNFHFSTATKQQNSSGSPSWLKNEHRLIIQLVIGAVALCCQGAIYVFAIFAPTLKSEPFFFKEREVNMIASISALASFFNYPAAVIFDGLMCRYCFGPRPTLAVGGSILSIAWIMLSMFVFNPKLFLNTAERQTIENGYNNNNFSTTTTLMTSTALSSSPPHHMGMTPLHNISSSSSSLLVAPEHYLAFVTILFCLVMCSATFLELAIVVANMDAWRYHHGWIIISLKSWIGIGGSIISLIYASEFSPKGEKSEDPVESLNQAGNFCMFLGLFSALSTILGTLFTTAPPPPAVSAIDNNSNNENTENSQPFWDVRVIGINTMPVSTAVVQQQQRRSQDEDDMNNNNNNNNNDTGSSSTTSNQIVTAADIALKISARARVKPMMTKGLWILLFCFIVVTSSNAIELGVSGLPDAALTLIGVLNAILPLLFLFLMKSFYSDFAGGAGDGDDSSADVAKRFAIPTNDDENSQTAFAEGSPQAQVDPSSSTTSPTSITPSAIHLPQNLEQRSTTTSNKQHRRSVSNSSAAISSSERVPSANSTSMNNHAAASSHHGNSNNNSHIIQQAEVLKQKGNDAYTFESFQESIEIYSQAIDLLGSSSASSVEASSTKPKSPALTAAASSSLLNATLYSNRSASYLRIGKADLAVRDANSCIRLSPQWFKGYYRRAAGLIKLKKLKDALADLEAASTLAPTNTEVAHAVIGVKRTLNDNNNNRKNESASSSEKPSSYKHQLVAFLEEATGKTRKGLPLRDIEDDFESEITATAQNNETVFKNMCLRPLDFFAMWVMFFGLWGSTVMIYSNIYSIYYSLQGDYTFTSARNAVFVSFFGLGNSLGRVLSGASLPFLQSRGRPIWSILKVAPMLNIVGLGCFFVCRGAGLALPFLITAMATGMTWGGTIIFIKRVFVLVGSHYSFCYSAGGAGILCLCFGMFASEYEKHALMQHHHQEQDLQQQQQNFQNTNNMNNNGTFDNNGTSTTMNPASSKLHCVGFDCVKVSLIVCVCLNFLSLILAEWLKRRIDLGHFDSGLLHSSNNNLKGAFDRKSGLYSNEELVLIGRSRNEDDSRSSVVSENDYHQNDESERRGHEAAAAAAFSLRNEQGEFESFSPFTPIREEASPNLVVPKYEDQEMV